MSLTNNTTTLDPDFDGFLEEEEEEEEVGGGETETDADQLDDTPDATSDPDDEPLGAPGLKALKAERARVAALSAELAEIRKASMTEAERVAAERDELRTQLDQMRRDAAHNTATVTVTNAATKAGSSNPTLVAKLILADAEIGEDGTVTNLDALVRDLQKSAPELFPQRPGTVDAGAGRQQPAGDDPNSRIRAALLNRI